MSWERNTKTNRCEFRINAKRAKQKQLKRGRDFFARAVKLNELGFSNYREYLRSDRWAKRRKEYEKNHLKECYCCGSYGEIVLHHNSYANVGRELDSDLVWLCTNCHEGVHNSIEWNLGEKRLANAHVHYKKNDPPKKRKKAPKKDRDVPKPRRVVTVTLQQKRIDELRQLAQLKSSEQRGITYSDLIREAIDCYLGYQTEFPAASLNQEMASLRKPLSNSQ